MKSPDTLACREDISFVDLNQNCRFRFLMDCILKVDLAPPRENGENSEGHGTLRHGNVPSSTFTASRAASR